MLCGGSIGLQADTVTLASGVPLEFPAPPSLQILAIARYRCGLRLVWHENPSLLFVPPRMKHYTSDGCETDLEGMNAGRCDQLYAVVDNDALTIDQADRHAGTAQDIQIVRQSTART